MLEKVKTVKEEEEEKKSATKPRPYRHIKVCNIITQLRLVRVVH